MNNSKNEELIREYFRLCAERQLHEVRRLQTDDFVAHTNRLDIPDREKCLEFLREKAASDHVSRGRSILQILCSADKAAMVSETIWAVGGSAEEIRSFAITFFTIRDGKIAEMWTGEDLIPLVRLWVAGDGSGVPRS